MNGFGLCLWRLGRFDEAGRVFDRMLWLNPSDSQGVRFLIDHVRAKAHWEGSGRLAVRIPANQARFAAAPPSASGVAWDTDVPPRRS
jgi:hypothetical protein